MIIWRKELLFANLKFHYCRVLWKMIKHLVNQLWSPTKCRIELNSNYCREEPANWIMCPRQKWWLKLILISQICNQSILAPGVLEVQHSLNWKLMIFRNKAQHHWTKDRHLRKVLLICISSTMISVWNLLALNKWSKNLNRWFRINQQLMLLVSSIGLNKALKGKLS